MSKRSKDNRDDNDALRMEDIVPPFRKAAQKAGGAAGESDHPDDIPRLNLAEKIMASQRRRTAARRSGPNSRRRPSTTAEQTGSAIPSEIPLLSEHQKIIREIVARDIDRLCNEAS